MTTISLNSTFAARSVRETPTSSPMVNRLIAGVLLAVSLVLAVTGIAISSPITVISAGFIAAGTSVSLAWTSVFAGEN